MNGRSPWPDAADTPPSSGSTQRPSGSDPFAPFIRTAPQLARGIVWSDLVREMEQEWADKLAARAAATSPDDESGQVLPLPDDRLPPEPEIREEAA